MFLEEKKMRFSKYGTSFDSAQDDIIIDSAQDDKVCQAERALSH